MKQSFTVRRIRHLSAVEFLTRLHRMDRQQSLPDFRVEIDGVSVTNEAGYVTIESNNGKVGYVMVPLNMPDLADLTKLDRFNFAPILRHIIYNHA